MRQLFVTTIFFSVVISSSWGQQESSQKFVVDRSTELTDDNFSKVHAAISANEEDHRWENISWRASFREALIEAREIDKPILLWMMNGHPCGMT